MSSKETFNSNIISLIDDYDNTKLSMKEFIEGIVNLKDQEIDKVITEISNSLISDREITVTTYEATHSDFKSRDYRIGIVKQRDKVKEVINRIKKT